MQHTIENEYLKVTVDEAGAELRSMLAADGTEFLWQGDKTYWADRAPILFPFVGRLTEGRYLMDGESYNLDIHGFAKDSVFSACAEKDGSLTMSLCSSPETLALYPRKFNFSVNYSLEGKRLNITFAVDNLDDRQMYFGLGGHPGFNLPLKSGLDFTDYRIAFQGDGRLMRLTMTDKFFMSGEKVELELAEGKYIPLQHWLFDGDAVVVEGKERVIRIESPKDTHAVTVSFPQIQYVGFWHANKTTAPYVCVEPWCTLPSRQDELTVFDENSGLLSLAPGERYENRWYIQLDF